MGAVEAILILSVVGFLLLAAEMFVPGMILGTLGAICLLAAVGVGYAHFGVAVGTVIFAVIGALSLVGFMVWMHLFPKTAVGRKILLSQTLEQGRGAAPRTESLVGEDGVSLTPLRPSGAARIAGRKIDVVAEGEFIAAGERVSVVREENLRVVVRKTFGSPEPSA